MAENQPNIEHGLGAPQLVIEQFQSDVDRLQATSIFSLPNLADTVNHQGKFTRPTTKTVDGLFIDTSQVAEPEPGVRIKPVGASFYVQPANRLTREKSHNQVFFGAFSLHYRGVVDADPTAQVAVKPTKGKREMLGELAMFQYLQESKIPTFTPNGFLCNDNQNYLTTKFNRGVATMDTVEWRYLDKEEAWAQVMYATETMALLHGKMLFHGDLEFKNVAFNETGELVIVDPELMVSALELASIANANLDEESLRALLRIKQLQSVDFNAVNISINDFVFGTMLPDERPRTDIQKFKEINRRVYRPYRETLITSGNEYAPLLLQSLDMLVSEHKQRARASS